ncbi:hypothetical protein PFFCH_03675 [Plasmodium falciparum FCH/4]|uniref:Uncharacterized protein n=1 Tax=Plasmodium falciparum FCH/4 TaxID=1036724 RepID=A0A024VJR7_PLAFA|nr:hypothetical protein PFFCH_03675 [Plasmodium falciparum FCH/4]
MHILNTTNYQICKYITILIIFFFFFSQIPILKIAMNNSTSILKATISRLLT